MFNQVLMLTSCFGGSQAADGTTEGSSSGSMIYMIVWVVILVVFMYFFMIRPQKKEKQKKEAMMNGLSVGDTVLTTSGFYGTVIDMDDETVIVEFGNNKNCRIPMQRAAVAAVEKPEDAQEAPVVEEKKGFFKKKEDKTES